MVKAPALGAQQLSQQLPPPPLPGGVAAAIRWFFQVPQWIQIAGLVLGLAVAGIIVWFLWKRRIAIWTWLKTRPTGVKAGLAVGVLLVAVSGGVFGVISFNYTQHENDFCQACHVMDVAYTRFLNSEHSRRKCHDCHQQPLYASLRQVYLWVLDRPQDIGPHAKVANEVCVKCHIVQDKDSTWQRISATAGHKVHLTLDSSALKDVKCVTCHGVEVHKFVPADKTCGQTGCHKPQSTQMVLGAMADSTTSFHCLACHKFTKPINEADSLRLAKQGLVPTFQGCLDCHDMRRVLANFEPDKDPHKGVCGDCHNPHTQTTPAAAIRSCTKAGCHSSAETLTAYHKGLNHPIAGKCIECHKAHVWKAPTECRSCHKNLS